MSALTTRCTDPKILLALCRASTHVANPNEGRESSRCTVLPLCGEQVKLLRQRQLLTADIFRLLFTQHMNQLDATQDHAGTVSGLEAVLSGWRRFEVYGRISGMSTTSNPYRGFRFPAEIINQAVWLYHCFSLSLREVELILAARGIVVSYETIREWSLRFGRTYAKTLKRRGPKPGGKWFLDEVFVRIRGKLHYLWRAVDQHGNVLDVLVQSHRDKKAATRFFRKLLKGLCYVPRVIVTDKLGSYGAAKREILPSVEHRQSRYLNNRCEVSHQPTRRRERHMKRFKSVRHAQQCLVSHTPIHNHLQLRRQRLSASEYRAARNHAFTTWRDVTGTARAG